MTCLALAQDCAKKQQGDSGVSALNSTEQRCPICGRVQSVRHVCPLQTVLKTQQINQTIPLHDSGKNQPELLIFNDGTAGIWKSWTGSESVAEVFTWEFTQQIGLDHLVPETAFYEARPGTVQRYVNDAQVGIELDDNQRRAAMESQAGLSVALLDYLTAQWDRNEGNWLVEQDGHIVAIDNGQAFSAMQTNSPFYNLHQGETIPAPVLKKLEQVERSYLDECFAMMKQSRHRRDTADRMWERIQKCIEQEVIPIEA